MKHFFCAAISIFFVAAMMGGCSSNNEDNLNGIDETKEIEYTAIEPVYEYDSDTMQSLIFYTNHAQDDEYDSFGEFYKYFSSEYKNTVSYGFYLLKPGDDLVGWLPDCLYREFQIFKRNDSSDYSIIHEYIMLRDTTLKSSESTNAEIEDGVSNSNITLSIYFAPVSNTVIDLKYGFEFGNNYNDDNFSEYINIYVNETCIATCYYSTSCKITYSWFSQYFKNNLIRG